MALARTTLDTPLHNLIRQALMEGYTHEFNEGKAVDPFLIEAQVHSVAETLAEQFEGCDETPMALAFAAIETERAYQDAGLGNAANTITGKGPGAPMTPGECLLTIEALAADARRIWYRPQNTERLMHFMRKIGGVAVQAMERFGAPKRSFTPQQETELAMRMAMSGIGGARNTCGPDTCPR